MTEVIMNLGKPSMMYHQIDQLSVISKLYKKLRLKKVKLVVEEKNTISSHQFGFRPSSLKYKRKSLPRKKYHRGSSTNIKQEQHFLKTWTETWHIKLDGNKSGQVDYTNKQKHHLAIRIN